MSVWECRSSVEIMLQVDQYNQKPTPETLKSIGTLKSFFYRVAMGKMEIKMSQYIDNDLVSCR